MHALKLTSHTSNPFKSTNGREISHKETKGKTTVLPVVVNNMAQIRFDWWRQQLVNG